MRKTRTIASNKHFFSLNHQFLCWFPKNPLKVPWRSERQSFQGTFKERPRDVECRLGQFFIPCFYLILPFLLDFACVYYISLSNLSTPFFGSAPSSTANSSLIAFQAFFNVLSVEILFCFCHMKPFTVVRSLIKPTPQYVQSVFMVYAFFLSFEIL